MSLTLKNKGTNILEICNEDTLAPSSQDNSALGFWVQPTSSEFWDNSQFWVKFDLQKLAFTLVLYSKWKSEESLLLINNILHHMYVLTRCVINQKTRYKR